VELAWLTGQPGDAHDAVVELTARTAMPGAERARADLRRWQRRLGLPAQPFLACPPEYAAGLRGDWRTAAQGFAELGAPYEQALELTDSYCTENGPQTGLWPVVCAQPRQNHKDRTVRSRRLGSCSRQLRESS